MCEQVSVGVCDWGWFTPAESHFRGLYQILSRCLPCQILAVFAVFGSTFTVRFLFWFRDSWALLPSWTPIAGDSSAHCFPALPASAYEELYFSFSHCITSCNKLSLFRNWILPSSLWQSLSITTLQSERRPDYTQRQRQIVMLKKRPHSPITARDGALKSGGLSRTTL